MTDLDSLIEKLRRIRREIRVEYLEPHTKPWIIGFSGGKDSTLLTPSRRQKPCSPSLPISETPAVRRDVVVASDPLGISMAVPDCLTAWIK
jgi:hypothetical protein